MRIIFKRFLFFRPPSKKSKFSDNSKIVDLPNFELKTYFKEETRKRLIIFTSADKSECFVYSFKKERKLYMCIACQNNGRKFVYAKILQYSNGVDYVQLSHYYHVCKPRKYDPYRFMNETTIEASYFQVHCYERWGVQQTM